MHGTIPQYKKKPIQCKIFFCLIVSRARWLIPHSAFKNKQAENLTIVRMPPPALGISGQCWIFKKQHVLYTSSQPFHSNCLVAGKNKQRNLMYFSKPNLSKQVLCTKVLYFLLWSLINYFTLYSAMLFNALYCFKYFILYFTSSYRKMLTIYRNCK